MHQARIKLGFYAGAIFNIAGILVFTRAFTNDAFFQADPAMFSRPACVVVILWGLAYAAQARTWQTAPAISLVFALEKLVYVLWWVWWLAMHGQDLGVIFDRDAMAGVFYGIYGAGDALFCLFFAWAARQALATRR